MLLRMKRCTACSTSAGESDPIVVPGSGAAASCQSEVVEVAVPVAIVVSGLGIEGAAVAAAAVVGAAVAARWRLARIASGLSANRGVEGMSSCSSISESPLARWRSGSSSLNMVLSRSAVCLPPLLPLLGGVSSSSSCDSVASSLSSSPPPPSAVLASCRRAWWSSATSELAMSPKSLGDDGVRSRRLDEYCALEMTFIKSALAALSALALLLLAGAAAAKNLDERATALAARAVVGNMAAVVGTAAASETVASEAGGALALLLRLRDALVVALAAGFLVLESLAALAAVESGGASSASRSATCSAEFGAADAALVATAAAACACFLPHVWR